MYQKCAQRRKETKEKIQQQYEDNIIKNIRNHFRPKEENEAIKEKINRDIKNIFEKEEDNYNPIRVGNPYSIRYIEYQTNVDGNKTPSIEEYLIKIRPSLKDITKNLEKQNPWKNQLTITINFISFKGNDRKRVSIQKE